MPRRYDFDEEEEYRDDPYGWMMDPSTPMESIYEAPPSSPDPGPGMFDPMPVGSAPSFDENEWMNQPTKQDFGMPGGAPFSPDASLYAPFDADAYMEPTSRSRNERSPYGAWMDNERNQTPETPGITTTTPSVPQPVTPGRGLRNDERDRRAGLPPRYNVDWDAQQPPGAAGTVPIGQQPPNLAGQPPLPTTNTGGPIGPTPPGSLAAPSVPRTTSATTPPATTPGANATIGNGQNVLEGFNLVRAQNPKVSAKDAFAAVAMGAPKAPETSKEASAQWFNQYIKPGFEAYGHKVNSVTGDQFTFTSPEGTFTVDYHRGAGAPGSALAWQVQGAPGTGGAAGGAANASGLGGAKSVQDAFAQVRSLPANASKEQMESWLTAAFGGVPGFGGAYKESVMINGKWYDLINAYDPGKGGSWVAGWPSPKDGGGGSSSSGMSGGGMGTSSVGGGVSGIGAGVPGAAGVSTSSLVPSYEELLQLIGRG